MTGSLPTEMRNPVLNLDESNPDPIAELSKVPTPAANCPLPGVRKARKPLETWENLEFPKEVYIFGSQFILTRYPNVSG